MLRAALIRLSSELWIGRALERSSAGRVLVARFVSGPGRTDAVAAAKRLGAAGSSSTLALLGEDVTEPAAAEAAVEEYLQLIAALASESALDVRIALKPSLIGSQISFEAAREHLLAIVDVAAAAPLVVEIDMEGSGAVDDTLALYRAAAARSASTAVAVQACLHRTPDDLAGLVDEGIARVRLVKGAYSEPRETALQDGGRIRRAYRAALEQICSRPSLAAGGWVGVATHDPRLHRAVRRLAAEREVPADAWEFQLLYGVRPQLRGELIERGERVRVSIPYGERWYPYFVRRIAERPANALFALRAFTSR